MTTVNTERLHARLDRGDAIVAAAAHARNQAATAGADARVKPNDVALAARAARLRTAADALATQASAWSTYCNNLRTLAATHGVQA